MTNVAAGGMNGDTAQLASICSDHEQVPANSGWFDIRVQTEKVYGIKLLL
jgi:hypothetical protein